MKIIGPYCHKRYECPDCGHHHMLGTNHWGEVYSRCPNCGWKYPMGNSPQQCMEAPPEGYGTPEKWKIVKLGDIAEIS